MSREGMRDLFVWMSKKPWADPALKVYVVSVKCEDLNVLEQWARGMHFKICVVLYETSMQVRGRTPNHYFWMFYNSQLLACFCTKLDLCCMSCGCPLLETIVHCSMLHSNAMEYLSISFSGQKGFFKKKSVTLPIARVAMIPTFPLQGLYKTLKLNGVFSW